MALKAEKIDTWAAALEDKPGALAAKLEALSRAGVNVEFLLARRAPDKPGGGVVFVTPIKGAAGIRAAKAAGFVKTNTLHAVRLAGPDKKGLGAKITRRLADRRLNLRGLSAAVTGRIFVAHLALDTAAAAAKAMRILRAL